MLVLGGRCTSNIYDGLGSRTVLIFPSPSNSSFGLTGSFTLIEDDGRTNDHLEKGLYTELALHFAVKGAEVEVRWELVHGGYSLPYQELTWELPKGDTRKVVAASGMEWRRNEGDEGERFSLLAPKII
jgi:alpha-glucosidase